MDREEYIAALAGLLYDIGNLAQRGGWIGGAHPEASGEFVRRFVPSAWQQRLYSVMGHHDRPLQGYETKVVALADRLSAGERIPKRKEKGQPRQLLSVFCSLTADGQRAPKQAYWPLSPLRMAKETLFPIGEVEEQEVQHAYDNLWREFSADAAALREAHEKDSSLPVYLESMLLLLQRYTWCVPSSYYRALPDVSLYDHSRTTAALAVCLLGKNEATLDQVLRALEQWHEARKKNHSAPMPDELEETKAALLVGGDISGVQDFIYTITARGATSALRGRSFYLQLLTEAVARFVLRRLNLPITNLLYQGGGGFYLLARPSDQDELEKVQRDVSLILLAHHRGDLYLALEAVSLAVADFYDGRISGKWRELGERLQKAKQRRFAELGDKLNSLFQPEGHGGNEERECQVCGREHPGTTDKGAKDNPVRKCPPCRSYESLGDSLRRARYLWLAQVEPSVPENPLETTPRGWDEVLVAFGMQARVGENLKQISKQILKAGSSYWILALKDEALNDLKPDSRTVVGRRFLVNVTPTYETADALWLRQQPREVQKTLRRELPQEPEGKVKPFTLLEAQSTGVKRLGVLRMDVDDLGKLFAEGFGDNATLSRVAALSFAISLFFEGWVEVLAERIGKTEDGQQRLYSIYSGGDDLFFVGSWDAVVELTRAIRADLTSFAARHPGVHASAGIALVGGKYPLYQAAKDAGVAEGQAKSLRWRGGDGRMRRKDAVSFLGRALGWRLFGMEDCEVEGLGSTHQLAHRLERMVKPKENKGEGVPQALLHALIRLYEMYETAAEHRRRLGEDRTQVGEEQAYWGPWMWRGYYFLKRMAGRYKGSTGKAIADLADSLHGERFRAIEWIGLAARWAELLVR